MTSNIDKVRVLVVGDSGVGKTNLTHLIAHNDLVSHVADSWTVGCNIEVKLHEFKEGTPQQQTYFIELFDIGGSLSHRNTRGVFYNPTHGIILVHDLTNRKSQENLREWLYEILNKDGKDTCKPGNFINMSHGSDGSCLLDPEQFMGTTQIPILVVGTKLDLIDDKRQPKSVHRRSGGIADHCGAEEIWLNCRRSLDAGTTDAVKLSRFFDKVIEKKMQNDSGLFGSADRRKNRLITPSPYPSPEYSLLGPPERKLPTTRNILLESNGLQ